MRFEEIPSAEARAHAVAAGYLADLVKALFDGAGKFAPQPVTDAVEKITGHAPRSIRQWAATTPRQSAHDGRGQSMPASEVDERRTMSRRSQRRRPDWDSHPWRQGCGLWLRDDARPDDRAPRSPRIRDQCRPCAGSDSGRVGVLSDVGGSSGVAVVVTGLILAFAGLLPVATLAVDVVVGAAPPERAGAASAITNLSGIRCSAGHSDLAQPCIADR